MRLAAVLAVLFALAGLGRVARTEILADEVSRASDALPLYLSGAAVAERLDPTEEASLAKVYDERRLTVGAATFSTLYPATAGVILRPYAALDWDGFTAAWRWTLLTAVAGFGLAAGVATGGGWRGLLWGGAVTATLAWHPVTAECVRLGQVNLVLGALCALAMALIPRSRAAQVGAGLLLGLGGVIKLVPGALLLPALATRRWVPTVAAGLFGAVILALVLPVTPLGDFIEAVRGTLRFQAAIDPDWLVGRDPAPPWMRLLGFARHEPLQWITLALAGLVPALRPSPRTAVAGMATLCAWLGADAAGFHVLYAPLAYPVFVLLAGDWRASVALALPYYALAWFPATLGAEPRMVLFGLLAWVAAVVTLLRAAAAVAPGPAEADPELNGVAVALGGVLTGALLVGAVPGEGPVAAPLPEGRTTPEGPGFIHANDRVPGEVRALGGGLDRPASTLARPGTIRALQLYLRGAPVRWRSLAETYPARASLFEGRATAVPGGDLRDHSGREIAAWLLEEQATITQLQGEGIDVGELGPALEAALASGLTDPALEERVRE